ncbi:aminopeptidase P family protein [Cetobacterium sp. SF1]|uniref:aminopeptidase P family protein n=1 Tax=unclassified Cetobacterium TaxID=2630983 RepID=UPI003CEDC860
MSIEKIMEEKELQGILITNILNVRYLTGFSGSTGLALVTRDKKYFITDFRYVSQGEKEVTKNGFVLVREDKNPLGKIGELLRENEVKNLGIEDQSVTLSQMESFKKNFPEIKYHNLEDDFLKLRMIKKDYEIKIIKESIKIAEEALKSTIPQIKIGISERELCAILEYEMKRRGADKPSFDIIVASNDRSALPHGVASDKIIEEGFLTIDYGCFYKGYASDITRTFYVGKHPTEKHMEIYNIVKEANERAIEAIKPGMTTKELDKIARDYITEKGYGDKFGHGLGHGFGLQIHEYPFVSSKATEVTLEPNMVITIEPGIYIENFGGVRIEDDILITKNGYEVLTGVSKEFQELS